MLPTANDATIFGNYSAMIPNVTDILIRGLNAEEREEFIWELMRLVGVAADDNSIEGAFLLVTATLNQKIKAYETAKLIVLERSLKNETN